MGFVRTETDGDLSWSWSYMTAMLWKPSSLPRVPLSQDKNCDKEELLVNVSELPVSILGQGTRLSSLPQTLQALIAQILGDLKARLWPKF